MTTARQIAGAAAVLLVVGFSVLATCAEATLPRPKSRALVAMFAHGTARRPATTGGDVYLNDRMALALFDQLCRNDPVNNLDPLGLSSLDRYLAGLAENVGGGANAVSCFFDQRDATDQRLRGGIRSFAGSVGEAVGLIGSVQAHRAEAILSFGFGRGSRVTMLAGDCGGWFHDRAGAFCVSAGDLAWAFSRDALSAAVEQQSQHAELASLARAVQERGWRTVGAEFAPHYAGFAAGLVDGNWRDSQFQTAATYVALDFVTVLLNWSAGTSTRGVTAAKGEVALDANALVNAIEETTKGNAIGAMRGRAPVVSPTAVREFLRGSRSQIEEMGIAGARQANAARLRTFLTNHGGRIGAYSTPVGRASAVARGARVTPRNIRLRSHGDPGIVSSAEREGLDLLTNDDNLLQNFPFTEGF